MIQIVCDASSPGSAILGGSDTTLRVDLHCTAKASELRNQEFTASAAMFVGWCSGVDSPDLAAIAESTIRL